MGGTDSVGRTADETHCGNVIAEAETLYQMNVDAYLARSSDNFSRERNFFSACSILTVALMFFLMK